MSYWLELQAREKLGDRLREAAEWRLHRMAGNPSSAPTRPVRRTRLPLRLGR